MKVQAQRRSRLGAVYVLMAALVSAGAVVSMAPTSKAQAEPNRRICKYVWMEEVGNNEGRTVSFVVNYKKDGACPYIDLHKVQMPKGLGQWMPPPDTWEKQPVPKMTCEEFQTAEHLPSSRAGGDPCSYMVADRLYGVTSWLADDPDPTSTNKARIWAVGDVQDLA